MPKQNVCGAKSLFVYFAIFIFGLIPTTASAADISVFPEKIMQGEPFLVRVMGVKNISSIKKINFDGLASGIFPYQNSFNALVGIDLNKKPGTYELEVDFSDGQTLKKSVEISVRPKTELPLGIPQKLGGNTAQSQVKLVSTLAEENKSLLNLYTGKKSFWSEKFRWPLKETVVTDEYGYSRKTGDYSIAHKGVDFRAKQGTQVLAINRGVVRVAKEYRNYGKTVVVDHGLGLMSFYMHLSKIRVNVGELVRPGQVIGLSGQTGYAESPHLHFTLRINDISVDPMKFFEILK